MAACHDGQIALSIGAFQKRFCSVPSKPVFLIHFKVSTPFIVTAVEIGNGRYTCLSCCFTKSIKNLPTQALFLDSPLATSTVEFIRTAVMILRFQENR